ncbi:hypothetical protein BDF14DRAFT_1820679 [Spinellus fusiger]|nr:hypothetical protein BDF14DRAFT_1820679 [Spinellus fusiger]
MEVIEEKACNVESRKQKEKKTVQFNTHQEIILTYSAEEYDRGGIFSFPVLYKLNPSVLMPTSPRPVQKPKLSLAIPESYIDSEESASSSNSNDSSSNDNVENADCHGFLGRKQRPKLKVDTTVCTGPRFFTDLSTNHIRSKIHVEDSMEDIYHNEYLVPMSAHVL